MTDCPDSRSYRNFEDLARAQVRGRDYEISVNRRPASRIAVIAPHGGEIENGTSEVARAIAGEEFNLYLFEGTRTSRNYFALHLTSHLFDEPECLALVASCTSVLAVHGCAGLKQEAFLGGRDIVLRDQLAAALHVKGIFAPVDGHRFPATQPSNVCNRGATRKGVQLELSEPLRESSAWAPVVAGARGVLLAAAMSPPLVVAAKAAAGRG